MSWLSGWPRFHTATSSLSRCCARCISRCDLWCQTCLASAMLGLPCHAMVCDLQKLEACCLPTSWWTPLVCATELGRGRDCVVAISTLVPCNRVGSVNQLRAWVLQFFAYSWSPAAGFFKRGGLQRPNMSKCHKRLDGGNCI